MEMKYNQKEIKLIEEYRKMLLQRRISAILMCCGEYHKRNECDGMYEATLMASGYDPEALELRVKRVIWLVSQLAKELQEID